MSVTRREFLATSGGFAALAMIVGPQARLSRPVGAHTLLLYSMGFRDTALAAQLHRGPPAGVIAHTVSVLSRDGFAATRALLEALPGYRLSALLNDADGLVVETLLARRGARGLSRQAVAPRAILLTATL